MQNVETRTDQDAASDASYISRCVKPFITRDVCDINGRSTRLLRAERERESPESKLKQTFAVYRHLTNDYNFVNLQKIQKYSLQI